MLRTQQENVGPKSIRQTGFTRPTGNRVTLGDILKPNPEQVGQTRFEVSNSGTSELPSCIVTSEQGCNIHTDLIVEDTQITELKSQLQAALQCIATMQEIIQQREHFSTTDQAISSDNTELGSCYQSDSSAFTVQSAVWRPPFFKENPRWDYPFSSSSALISPAPESFCSGFVFPRVDGFRMPSTPLPSPSDSAAAAVFKRPAEIARKSYGITNASQLSHHDRVQSMDQMSPAFGVAPNFSRRQSDSGLCNEASSYKPTTRPDISFYPGAYNMPARSESPASIWAQTSAQSPVLPPPPESGHYNMASVQKNSSDAVNYRGILERNVNVNWNVSTATIFDRTNNSLL